MTSRELGVQLEEHRRFIWGLGYRMTASAADADDIVQDTFRRALERPPLDTTRPWRPWLVKVALNLSRDRLRKRKRQSYTGPWLPAPIETPTDDPAFQVSAESRYAELESVTYAFLLALEELTPQRRAVLILRDVFDYSVRETADALEMTESNVKVVLHRARKQLSGYDAQRRDLEDILPEVQAALASLVQALATHDVAAMESILHSDVQALTDGAGVYHAALKPIIGADKVQRFFFGLKKTRGMPDAMSVRQLNGLPALVLRFDQPRPNEVPLTVVRVEVKDGLVHALHSILAPAKLLGLDDSLTHAHV